MRIVYYNIIIYIPTPGRGRRKNSTTLTDAHVFYGRKQERPYRYTVVEKHKTNSFNIWVKVFLVILNKERKPPK